MEKETWSDFRALLLIHFFPWLGCLAGWEGDHDGGHITRFSSSDMYVYALVPGWILYGMTHDDGQCIYVCLDDCDLFSLSFLPFFLS